jgi:hypothetical protein
MEMNDLINTFSSAVATHYQECLMANPRPQNVPITLDGMNGRSTIHVTDIVISITKERFGALWNQNCILEARITHFLRKLHIDADCSYVELKTDHGCIYFRQTAPILTQTPQAFLPPYMEDFSLLQEVIQGQFAITSAINEKPILATWHLVECVAFTAFDAHSKVGVLAHLDRCADIEQLFNDIKSAISPSQRQVEFQYVLTGGIESLSIREKIKKAAAAASNGHFNFYFLLETESELPQDDFLKDSKWCTSMRLRRSIAIDTRAVNPLQNLMSYEPRMNTKSFWYTHTHTKIEALRFEFNRECTKLLQRV